MADAKEVLHAPAILGLLPHSFPVQGSEEDSDIDDEDENAMCEVYLHMQCTRAQRP